MFLDGADAFKWIREHMEKSDEATLAVAFWGSGALSELGIGERSAAGKPLKIICNLRMGGTNPDEIEKLMKLENVTVVQSDRLHGKVYRFNDSALLGSANASANGLCFEGKELHGWHEANIITSNSNVLEKIDIWVSRLESRPVSKQDLEDAKNVWVSRRSSSLNSSNAADDIHNWLLSGLSAFDGRPVFLVAYCDDNLTDEAIAISEIATAQYGQGIDWFEDWPLLPKDGILVSFLVQPNGKIRRADGLFERRSEIEAIPIAHGDRKLELCLKCDGRKLIKKQQNNLWEKVMTWLVKQPFNEKTGHGWHKDHGFIELSKVAEAIESNEIIVEAEAQ
jgi:hypothetical protein